MAVTVASSSLTTVSSTNRNSVVITKPTGLAVGDLLLAHISRNGAGTLTEPSGFTVLRTDVGGGALIRNTISYKIADATDVAASNFTWSWTLTDLINGGLMRITGFNTAQLIYASSSATATDTANPSFANTITPFVPESLLVMFLAGGGNDNPIGGYAVATSNPSWTESWDGEDGSANGVWMAAAFANRTQVTATGNSSVTGGEATMDSNCVLLTIGPANETTQTDTTTITDATVFGFAIIISDVLSITDTVTATATRLWNTVTKNVSTWYNQNKT